MNATFSGLGGVRTIPRPNMTEQRLDWIVEDAEIMMEREQERNAQARAAANTWTFEELMAREG